MPERAASAWVALAFDFGRKRIGVAAGNSVTRRATPLDTVVNPDAGIDWPGLERTIHTHHPAVLIVGMPYNADGSPGALTAAAQQFAAELGRRTQLPVESVDERWSSLEANEALRGARRSGQRNRRVRREDVDAAAACVILERWFESHAADTSGQSEDRT